MSLAELLLFKISTKYRYAASSKHNRVIDIFLTLEQLEI
jgi:hypothetical protein